MRMSILAVVVGMVVLGGPRESYAQFASSCFVEFGQCMMRAGSVEGFWWRFASGLDCELALISCARHAIFGY
ncbi:MAG: hypothetical protein FJW23_03240 [Acidimicrobiia bacterium]|nr:hypothetical protein [Acidimicrobiia bacterium]